MNKTVFLRSGDERAPMKNVDDLSSGKKMVVTLVMFSLIFLSEFVGANEVILSFVYEFSILVIGLMVFLLACDMFDSYQVESL